MATRLPCYCNPCDPARLPLAPLAQLEPNRSALARRVGCARRTVARWAHAGLMPAVADEVAARLGLHPADIWGDDWWLA